MSVKKKKKKTIRNNIFIAMFLKTWAPTNLFLKSGNMQYSNFYQNCLWLDPACLNMDLEMFIRLSVGIQTICWATALWLSRSFKLSQIKSPKIEISKIISHFENLGHLFPVFSLSQLELSLIYGPFTFFPQLSEIKLQEKRQSWFTCHSESAASGLQSVQISFELTVAKAFLGG